MELFLRQEDLNNSLNVFRIINSFVISTMEPCLWIVNIVVGNGFIFYIDTNSRT